MVKEQVYSNNVQALLHQQEDLIGAIENQMLKIR